MWVALREILQGTLVLHISTSTITEGFLIFLPQLNSAAQQRSVVVDSLPSEINIQNQDDSHKQRQRRISMRLRTSWDPTENVCLHCLTIYSDISCTTTHNDTQRHTSTTTHNDTQRLFEYNDTQRHTTTVRELRMSCEAPQLPAKSGDAFSCSKYSTTLA